MSGEKNALKTLMCRENADVPVICQENSDLLVVAKPRDLGNKGGLGCPRPLIVVVD